MGSFSRLLSTTALVLLLTTFLFDIVSASGYSYQRTHIVKTRQSIQKAINHASPGDRIIVQAGTYKEQLVIMKSGIELIGKPGAKLRPPTPYKKNLCSGIAFLPGGTPVTHAGICIHGKGIEFAEGPIVEHRKITGVKEPIRGVSVSGFDISGFNGLSVAILGAKDTKVFRNKLSKSDLYGALTVYSKNTRIFENKVQSTDALRFIGICMDDKSDVHVIRNTIFGYGIGLCVQTNGADVRDNDVSGGCIGAFIDPGIIGAQVKRNYVHAPNADCANGPYKGSYGISIGGADRSEVKQNTVKGYLFGILLGDDDKTPPQEIAQGNKIIENKILGSTGQDILPLSVGTGNVIKRNKCKTPAELCDAQF